MFCFSIVSVVLGFHFLKFISPLRICRSWRDTLICPFRCFSFEKLHLSDNVLKVWFPMGLLNMNFPVANPIEPFLNVRFLSGKMSNQCLFWGFRICLLTFLCPITSLYILGFLFLIRLFTVQLFLASAQSF